MTHYRKGIGGYMVKTKLIAMPDTRQNCHKIMGKEFDWFLKHRLCWKFIIFKYEEWTRKKKIQKDKIRLTGRRKMYLFRNTPTI